MKRNCKISEVNMPGVQYVKRYDDRVDAATLDNNWGINIEAAKRTHLVTTQRGVKRTIHPSISRRFRTEDRQLRYHFLSVT
jgi:hypothetical protein